MDSRRYRAPQQPHNHRQPSSHTPIHPQYIHPNISTLSHSYSHPSYLSHILPPQYPASLPPLVSALRVPRTCLPVYRRGPGRPAVLLSLRLCLCPYPIPAAVPAPTSPPRCPGVRAACSRVCRLRQLSLGNGVPDPKHGTGYLAQCVWRKLVRSGDASLAREAYHEAQLGRPGCAVAPSLPSPVRVCEGRLMAPHAVRRAIPR
jgi:hypothetical protein